MIQNHYDSRSICSQDTASFVSSRLHTPLCGVYVTLQPHLSLACVVLREYSLILNTNGRWISFCSKRFCVPERNFKMWSRRSPCDAASFFCELALTWALDNRPGRFSQSFRWAHRCSQFVNLNVLLHRPCNIQVILN